jgi:hypothetical protein
MNGYSSAHRRRVYFTNSNVWEMVELQQSLQANLIVSHSLWPSFRIISLYLFSSHLNP